MHKCSHTPLTAQLWRCHIQILFRGISCRMDNYSFQTQYTKSQSRWTLGNWRLKPNGNFGWQKITIRFSKYIHLLTPHQGNVVVLGREVDINSMAISRRKQMIFWGRKCSQVGQRSGYEGSNQNTGNLFSFQLKQQYLTLKTPNISYSKQEYEVIQLGKFNHSRIFPGAIWL